MKFNFIIIGLTICVTDGSQRINSFGRFGVLDGKMCQSTHRSFTIYTASLMTCATWCLANSNCRSFFYGNISGNCYGCRYVSNGYDLWTEQGTIYYIRTDNNVVLATKIPEYSGIGLTLVWHEMKWGTICNDNWETGDLHYTPNNIKVLCKTIGYSGGIILGGRPYNMVTSYANQVQIWMDQLQCDGTEAHIFDCQFDGFGTHNCIHNEDVNARCA